MSLLNRTWRYVAAVTILVAGPTVMGEVYHPFAEPLDFDTDYQFFAPVDVAALEELSPRKRAYGWFVAADRSFLWVSRPDVEASAGTGDFGWGNRFDFGFMSEKDSGWLLGFRSIGGPNIYVSKLAERVDRQNPNDTGDPANPVLPPSDQNDRQLGYRVYSLDDSLNVFALSDMQINKTWRLAPYRYGGILEPMIGFRHSTMKDTAQNETYFRSQASIGTPGTINASTVVETLVTDLTTISNQMYGGQVGARYFNNISRWTLSSELRAFGMANFQTRAHKTIQEITEYSGLGGTVVINDTFSGTNTVFTNNNEFVFGFEARAEAAYQVTKYIQVRGGIEVLDFAKGIWRGANPGFGNTNAHSQNVQMAGYTFGLEINR